MQEIAELMKQLGEHVAGHEIRDMVKQVDLNQDGKVNMVEFEQVQYVKCAFFLQSFKLYTWMYVYM